MPAIVWDKTGSRTFESGFSKGVLYLKNGKAIPWNGLTNVTETSGRESSPVYFDGRKVMDMVSNANFAATLAAYTYPDEFLELEGLGRMVKGIYVDGQRPKTFALSYQTRVGSDVAGADGGYKIHLIYNATAVSSDKSYMTASNDPEAVEFEWEITAIPGDVPGFQPSAHIIIDSRYTDADLLADIELMLYGGVTGNPALPLFEDLMALLSGFFIIEITDNKDGTWTAETNLDDYIFLLPDGEFRIDNVEATYINPETYEVSDTKF